MVLTNPDLNGPVPLQVQPEIGDWGPRAVITARTKLRHRALAPLAFMTVLTALVGLGVWLFWQLQTGDISPEGKIVVQIGMMAIPIVFVASLVTTVLVWILGRPYRERR